MPLTRTNRVLRRVRPTTPSRRFLSIGVASLLAFTVFPGVASAQSETPAETAAREIQEARDRANAAAEAYFEAESTLDQLEDDLAGLEAEEVQLQAIVDDLRAQVELVAVARYVDSGTEGIPLLTDVTKPQDQVQAAVYTDVVTNTSADVLDQYDAAESALGDTQDEVARRQDEVEEQKDEFADLERAATDEVELLRTVEEERLKDEAVRKALEAQLAAERAAVEEQARIDAEAASRAQPNPGLVVPPSTQIPATTAAPAATATPGTDANPVDTASTSDPTASAPGASAAPPTQPAATTAPATSPLTTDPPVTNPPVTSPPATDPPVTNPPETTVPENNAASGGTSGGRTGGGGGGNNPAPPAPPTPPAPPAGVAVTTTFVDGIICPMPGSAYADTWGAARSGGRRHEGVDMIAPRGLPIYAVTNGTVTFKSNRLGGNAVSLVGDNGTRYYYAHLDRYEGSSRRVVQGELIGYNGDTGNAKFSTPHLHFEVHPGGGRAVNPYPTVRGAGC